MSIMRFHYLFLAYKMGLEIKGEKPVQEGWKNGGDVSLQSGWDILQCFSVKSHT